MQDKILLFENKSECCGCGACKLICPQKAITMKEDLCGFFYPEIDFTVCISCRQCQKVCAYQNHKESNEPLNVFAVSLKDYDFLYKCASGGIFGGLAKKWIEENGYVIGASLIKENNKLVVKHICINNENELEALLGSKYVQSNLNEIFELTRQLLNRGEKVLFSGTPCQVSGLKAYLKKDYCNLVTIDFICHGVPSLRMFQEYIKNEEKKIHKQIQYFTFRDKDYGFNAKMFFFDNNELKFKNIKSYNSSFYEMFLNSDIYRENCYKCPYANKHHPADLTIGDFWGIEKEHPEFLYPNGFLDQSNGVSVLIINTKKGNRAFEKNKDAFWYYSSSFEQAAKYNKQLNHPSIMGENRTLILTLFQKYGYRAVDKWFWRKKKKENFLNFLKYHLHNDIPKPIRYLGKNILIKIKR